MSVIVEVRSLGATRGVVLRVEATALTAAFCVSIAVRVSLVVPCWPGSGMLVLLLVAGGLGFKLCKVVISGGHDLLVSVAFCSVGVIGGLGLPETVEVSLGATGGVDTLAFSVGLGVSISACSLVVS